MDEKKIHILINAIEDKGYIGAGPLKLLNDPNWNELRISLFPSIKTATPKKVVKKAAKK